MNNIFKTVLFFGSFMIATVAMEDRFDLTKEEDAAVNRVLQHYQLTEPALDDESVKITPQIAQELVQASRSAVQKMLACNEAYVSNPEAGTTADEVRRLRAESALFRQALQGDQ